ncbi:ATP-binding cassette domain-containing protein [Clostridium tyrobutyricum]|uniref:Methionine ABC transporter ATP-binding protein n=1 Tax=Clostridium tyrobutyricum DIVETGP TaxID=1408889 RepID=W6N8I3_CLOTY|nr:ATP-binding cassette domain-containing protein [Clostridium tyrobutyricum]AND84626.1 ABC-type metal ion transport system, ATPase component [Clostridium tyrobutyricum]ANP69231.1 methionine ABC transporter ATP-binding protein [Clostridium tyrobutyricum]MBR9648653.1 ATP-binding cassette domain-containing protein [Clostridium tyrobutyricum]MBV4416661.1 ATP-binding cassette domain-containing protein [Clostridium tyrobutyricum]MBV4421308.1 ATP-binding cassette domain-containing protein [Clostridi
MIELKNINVVFNVKNTKVYAVKDVNLKINRGEVFGIVGLSGAGKSTLVRTINLLQKPTSGKVIIDGKDITHLKGELLRKIRLNIGMIFQHFNLISGKTVYKNVEFVLKANNYPKNKRKQKVEELLKLVSLEDKAKAYPANLSGGQKQRVGIARALANNPQVLLCDEATSALDLENTEEILNLLKRINKKYGITIVFITHEMEVAKTFFNRMAVMSSGKIVEINDVYSIFANPKAKVTKSLINKNLNIELSPGIEKLIQVGELVKLYFKGDRSIDPLISDVSKKFNVNLSIIHGKIDYINDKPLGILIVNITGDKEEIEKAKLYMKENVSGIEENYNLQKEVNPIE